MDSFYKDMVITSITALICLPWMLICITLSKHLAALPKPTHVFQLQELVQQLSLVLLHWDKSWEHVPSLLLPWWPATAESSANSSTLLMLKLETVLIMFLELMSKLDNPWPGLLTTSWMASFCMASHTCYGIYNGCACRYNATTLTKCKDVMDVPDMKFGPTDQANNMPSPGAYMFMDHNLRKQIVCPDYLLLPPWFHCWWGLANCNMHPCYLLLLPATAIMMMPAATTFSTAVSVAWL